MASIGVTIKGISPIMMHAFPMQPIEALEKRPPEEQAELAAYRDPDTEDLYIPAEAVRQSMIAAATYSKGKGRASLQKESAACLLVSPERITLGVHDYKVDARPIVVPATKGRVMRFRPRLDDWSISFDLEYDPVLMTATQVRKVLDDAGSRIGLLEFRPQRKGPFGRFMVTKWNNGSK